MSHPAFGNYQPPKHSHTAKPRTNCKPQSDLYSSGSVIDNQTRSSLINPNHGADMTNLTTAFDALLKRHEAAPTKPFSLDTADEFLKEAYRIVRARPVCRFFLRWASPS